MAFGAVQRRTSMVNRTEMVDNRTKIAVLLADGDFSRLWGAGALIYLARWLETLAVGVFVTDLTGSAATVAIVGSMRMLPMLLFGAPVGTLANRFNRRSLLLSGIVTNGLFTLLLGLLALADAIAVWQIAFGSFLTGVLWASDFPVRRTILADIAGRAHTGMAMALEAAAAHVTRLAGVGLGGLLVGSTGIEGVYLLEAALYGLIGLLIAGMAWRDSPTVGDRPNFLVETASGLRSLAGERVVVAVLIVTIVYNVFGFAYISMIPVIGRTVLHADAFAIGLLSSAEAAASLVISLVFARMAPRRHLGAMFAFGVLVVMGGILIFALSRNYWLSLAVMAVTGAAMGSFSVTQSTLMLLASPPTLRASAMGALAICIGLAPVGMMHMGWMAENFGASAAVAISAVEGAVAVVAVILLFPRVLVSGPPNLDEAKPVPEIRKK